MRIEYPNGTEPFMQFLVTLLVALGLVMRATGAPPAFDAGNEPSEPFRFVLVISVDGLRPDAIAVGGSDRLPNLNRLAGGASTMNARTDPDFTITLPNHTCMITGRPVSGPNGHLWTGNLDPPPIATLQLHAGHDIDSIFTVAHEHGLRTGLFYGKSKFSLWVKSYNVGHDEQKWAITRSRMCPTIDGVTDGAIEALSDWDRGLIFLHYATTDLVGHAHGWDVSRGSAYMQAVADIDAQLGEILQAIDSDERHRATAIILTADHGGGAPRTTHEDPAQALNYTIPFLVWLGDGAPRADLYEINAAVRHDPGTSQLASPGADDEASEHLQPIRNGDAANLALSLLGLPAIPGSTINARQDLRVSRVEK